MTEHKSSRKPYFANGVKGMYTGRLNRLGFLMANIYWSILVLLIFSIITILIASSRDNAVLGVLAIIALPVALIAVLATYVVFVGIVVRRLHDVNQSGLLALILMVPVINNVLTIALLFIPGTVSHNQYGASAQRTLEFRDVSAL